MNNLQPEIPIQLQPQFPQQQIPHMANKIEQLPNDEEINNQDVFRKYGGIILTILILFSCVLFLLLFYDSMCIEKLANAKLQKAQALTVKS